MCSLCNNQEDDWIHIDLIQECSAMEQLNLQMATMENIFNEDVTTLKETMVCIIYIMEKVQNSWPNGWATQ